MVTNSVFVVDDDRLVRESLCEVLSDLGLDVRDAAGGLLAFESIRRDPTDMVVSDVDMPDISGFELLARLKHIAYGEPVLLMSARADENLRRYAREAGAADLVAKPIRIAAFTELVHVLLPRHDHPHNELQNHERPNHG